MHSILHVRRINVQKVFNKVLFWHSFYHSNDLLYVCTLQSYAFSMHYSFFFVQSISETYFRCRCLAKKSPLKSPFSAQTSAFKLVSLASLTNTNYAFSCIFQYQDFAFIASNLSVCQKLPSGRLSNLAVSCQFCCSLVL